MLGPGDGLGYFSPFKCQLVWTVGTVLDGIINLWEMCVIDLFYVSYVHHGPHADIFTGSRSRGETKTTWAPRSQLRFLGTCLPINLNVNECLTELEKVPKYIRTPLFPRYNIGRVVKTHERNRNKRQLFWLSITPLHKKWPVNHFLAFTLNWISAGPG